MNGEQSLLKCFISSEKLFYKNTEPDERVTLETCKIFSIAFLLMTVFTFSAIITATFADVYKNEMLKELSSDPWLFATILEAIAYICLILVCKKGAADGNAQLSAFFTSVILLPIMLYTYSSNVLKAILTEEVYFENFLLISFSLLIFNVLLLLTLYIIANSLYKKNNYGEDCKAEKRSAHTVMVTAALSAILIFSMLGAPIIYDSVCKNRSYDEFDFSSLDPYSSSVNVLLREETVHSEQTDGNAAVASISNKISSGVIVAKEGNKYYVLTAIENITSENDSILMIGLSGIPTYFEYTYRESGGKSDYYSSFYNLAKFEYRGAYDLVLLSFESDEDLPVLAIAKKDARKGDKLAAVCAADGKETAPSFGTVTSETKKAFLLQPAQKINAYVTNKNSGCAVLNENYELAGLVLGAKGTALGSFRYGAMISAEDIRSFLEGSGILSEQ